MKRYQQAKQNTLFPDHEKDETFSSFIKNVYNFLVHQNFYL